MVKKENPRQDKFFDGLSTTPIEQIHNNRMKIFNRFYATSIATSHATPKP